MCFAKLFILVPASLIAVTHVRGKKQKVEGIRAALEVDAVHGVSLHVQQLSLETYSNHTKLLRTEDQKPTSTQPAGVKKSKPGTKIRKSIAMTGASSINRLPKGVPENVLTGLKDGNLELNTDYFAGHIVSKGKNSSAAAGGLRGGQVGSPLGEDCRVRCIDKDAPVCKRLSVGCAADEEKTLVPQTSACRNKVWDDAGGGAKAKNAVPTEAGGVCCCKRTKMDIGNDDIHLLFHRVKAKIKAILNEQEGKNDVQPISPERDLVLSNVIRKVNDKIQEVFETLVYTDDPHVTPQKVMDAVWPIVKFMQENKELITWPPQTISFQGHFPRRTAEVMAEPKHVRLEHVVPVFWSRRPPAIQERVTLLEIPKYVTSYKLFPFEYDQIFSYLNSVHWLLEVSDNQLSRFVERMGARPQIRTLVKFDESEKSQSDKFPLILSAVRPRQEFLAMEKAQQLQYIFPYLANKHGNATGAIRAALFQADFTSMTSSKDMDKQAAELDKMASCLTVTVEQTWLGTAIAEHFQELLKDQFPRFPPDQQELFNKMMENNVLTLAVTKAVWDIVSITFAATGGLAKQYIAVTCENPRLLATWKRLEEPTLEKAEAVNMFPYFTEETMVALDATWAKLYRQPSSGAGPGGKQS